MPSTWRMRSRWPPSPSVEDEVESLAREVHGLSMLKETGDDGVCARGTIDQYPLIVSLDILPPPPLIPDSSMEELSMGNGSSDDSAGPSTPPPTMREELDFFSVGDFRSKAFRKPAALSHPVNQSRGKHGGENSRDRSRDSAVTPQQLRDGKSASCSHSRAPSRHPTTSDVQSKNRSISKLHSQNSREASVFHHVATLEKIHDMSAHTSRTSRRRSGSVRFESSVERSSNYQRVSMQRAGYLSDSATVDHRAKRERVKQPRTPQVNNPDLKELPHVPTLAERLEEKLRRRHELRDLETSSEQGSQCDQKLSSAILATSQQNANEYTSSKTRELNGSSLNTLPASAPQSPIRESRHGASPWTNGPDSTGAPSRLRASSTSSKLVPASVSQEKKHPSASFAAASNPTQPQPPPSFASGQLPKSMSSNEVPPSTGQQVTRRTVSFLDEVQPQPLPSLNKADNERSRPYRQGSPSKELVVQTSPNPSGLCLLPCPRSVPMAGHQDWYTIKGLTHLDICPSCMEQIGNSKFRDHFIPSLPKPRDQKLRCSMSEPWVRLAWVQTIVKQYDDLEMLYEISRVPPGSFPCTGRKISEQYWYRIVDRDSGMYLPKFSICSACIRNLRILMPSHQETFQRSTVMQERVCDLATDSPRFVQFIDLLDAAANRAEYERTPYPDMSEFLAYARRKVVLRDCRRDRLILSTWHYIPQLPELTVCEDCYDDVVWPLAKSNKPLARMFSTAMRLLPGDGPSRCREASCQLYSPRMRTKFRDAVMKDDFTYLKLIALRRYDAEQRFRDRKLELLDDERQGYDRDAELRRNAEEWKRWE